MRLRDGARWSLKARVHDLWPSGGTASHFRRVKYLLHIRVADGAEGRLGNSVSTIIMENPALDGHSTSSTAALDWGLYPHHVILHFGRLDLDHALGSVPAV